MNGTGFVIFVAAIAMLVQVVIAIRAYLYERREGLPRSIGRVAVTLLAAAGVAAAWWLQLPPSPSSTSAVATGAPSAAVAPPAPRLEVERLEREIAAKSSELQQLQDAKKRYEPSPSVNGQTTIVRPRFTLSRSAAAVAALVFAIGALLVLLLTGNRDTLLPAWLLRGQKRDRRAKLQAALQEIAAAASSGETQKAFDRAEELDVGGLSLGDRLKAVFLRAHSALRLVAEGAGLDRKKTLATTIRDLESLLADAPDAAEVEYLLAYARALSEQYEPALRHFAAARPRLGESSLPFAHNESVCYIALAEASFGAGDAAAADANFAKATALGVLADHVPLFLVENRILTARRHLAANQLDDARAALEAVRNVTGLASEQKASVSAICDAFSVLISRRAGDDEKTLVDTCEFLTRIVPANVPPVDDEAADECLAAVVDAKDVRLPLSMFRAFYFLEATMRARLEVRGVIAVSPELVEKLREPLLRALQFEPRQRDALAAIAVLYIWFVPDKRARALEWLESAVAMKVQSAIARRVLERVRASEQKRKELRDRFLHASGQFLADPTVVAQTRRGLIEEFGRFQEFQPLLLDAEQSFELGQRPPTVQSFRDRAQYIQALVSDSGQTILIRGSALDPIRSDYAEQVKKLEAAVARLTELDVRILQTIGRLSFGLQEGT